MFDQFFAGRKCSFWLGKFSTEIEADAAQVNQSFYSTFVIGLLA
jgi:hypothetical protein